MAIKSKPKFKRRKSVRSLFLPNIPKNVKNPFDQGAYLLDHISTENLELYKKTHIQLKEYYYEEYFYYAAERAKRESKLLDSLNQATTSLTFENHFRCVHTRYNDKPLSSAGSRISKVGGRFNLGDIGAGISPFPALYLGSTAAIAKSEFYQVNDNGLGISLEDFYKKSVSICRIHGKLSTVLDITNTNNLKPFLKVLSKIQGDENLMNKAIAVGLTGTMPSVSKMSELEDTLTRSDWRSSIMKFDIPANSQSFGELVRKAKIEAVLYCSKFRNENCLAIFPENLSPTSFVELSDPHPSGVIKRLDQQTYPNLI